MSAAQGIPGNETTRWSGTRFGYAPRLSTEGEELAAGSDEQLGVLLDALADPDRFVTAHVVLTRLSRTRYETFPTWNGLELTLGAAGDVKIDPAQRATLARRWRAWVAMKPRPDHLPDATT